jgi:hypothetical protein
MDLQYKITYKQGPTNLSVDALSRCHPTDIVALITLCRPAWIDRVKEGYVDEDKATQLLDELKETDQTSWKDLVGVQKISSSCTTCCA